MKFPSIQQRFETASINMYFYHSLQSNVREIRIKSGDQIHVPGGIKSSKALVMSVDTQTGGHHLTCSVFVVGPHQIISRLDFSISMHKVQLLTTSTYERWKTHLSKSVSREESRNPLANGLLSIFSFVIWRNKTVNNYFYLRYSSKWDRPLVSSITATPRSYA